MYNRGQLKARLQKVAELNKKEIIQRINESKESLEGKKKFLELFLSKNKNSLEDKEIRKQVDNLIFDIVYSCLDIIRSKRELTYITK